jgi:hypothetical protein
MCICFCHYVEQQLQDLHDHTQVLVTRLLDSQQQQQQLLLPHNQNPLQHTESAKQPQHQQQQQHPLANGNGSHNADGWQVLQHPQGRTDNSTHQSFADAGIAPEQQQQQQQQASEQQSQAAAAKLRLLSRPISDFSSCRREWVLKLGKAAAMGFVQQASGKCRLQE